MVGSFKGLLFFPREREREAVQLFKSILVNIKEQAADKTWVDEASGDSPIHRCDLLTYDFCPFWWSSLTLAVGYEAFAALIFPQFCFYRLQGLHGIPSARRRAPCEFADVGAC